MRSAKRQAAPSQVSTNRRDRAPADFAKTILLHHITPRRKTPTTPWRWASVCYNSPARAFPPSWSPPRALQSAEAFSFRVDILTGLHKPYKSRLSSHRRGRNGACGGDGLGRRRRGQRSPLSHVLAVFFTCQIVERQVEIPMPRSQLSVFHRRNPRCRRSPTPELRAGAALPMRDRSRWFGSFHKVQ